MVKDGGLTGAITESPTTFTVFLRIRLTSLLTRFPLTVLKVTDLLRALVH